MLYFAVLFNATKLKSYDNIWFEFGFKIGKDDNMRGLLKYLKGYTKQCIFGPLFKLLEACFELTVPIIMANIIDVGIANGDTSYIFKMCGLLVLMGVLGLCSAVTAQFFAASAAYGFGTALRADMFKKINSLSMKQTDSFGAASLITRMTGDINRMESGVNMFLRLFLRSPFIVIGAMVAAFTVNSDAAKIFLVAVPVLAIIIFFIMKISVPFYKKAQKSLDDVSKTTRENLKGVRVIRAFSAQQKEKDDFKNQNKELLNINMKVGGISALLNPVTYIVVNLAIIAVIWQGGKYVNGGTMLQGEVIALVNYLTQILVALIVLAQLIVTLNKALASSVRVAAVMNLTTDMKDGTETEIDKNAPALEFSDVTFSYGDSLDGGSSKSDLLKTESSNADYSKKDYSKASLKNVSFTLNQGETLGIIGGTGSGKSTLAGLIPRFYDTTSGTVKIFGKDVRDYKLSFLHKLIGYVPQKASLVSGTVRSNMQWRKKDATDEEIISALKIAQAYDFITEKDGLDTIVSQGGKNFSGGQRQRLTVARALVDNPKILIMDDSSSALDLMTEAKLRAAVSNLGKDTTCVIVSQRISAIRTADIILVLDDGVPAGMGKHNELVNTCDIYKEICDTQIPEETKGGENND